MVYPMKDLLKDFLMKMLRGQNGLNDFLMEYFLKDFLEMAFCMKDFLKNILM